MALEEYEPGSRFPGRIGTLHKVVLDLSGELITDPEAEMRAAMARQEARPPQ